MGVRDFKLISDIRLRWFDDSSLLTEDKRELVELFLESIGVSSDVARDVFEVVLIAKARDVRLTSSQIKEWVLELRRTRARKDADEGLSDRNIQIWLRFFREMRLLDKLGDKYFFTGNKKPSAAFREYTKPIADESFNYVFKVLEKLEKEYKIK